MSRTAAAQALVAQVQLLGQATMQMNQAAAQRAGINGLDLQVVQLLRTSEVALTASDLARAVGVSTAAATGLVDRLQTAGYVRRVADPDDRRRTLIELAQGRVGAGLGPVFAPLLHRWDKALRGYTAAELDLVREVLSALTADVNGSVTELRAPPAP